MWYLNNAISKSFVKYISLLPDLFIWQKSVSLSIFNRLQNWWNWKCHQILGMCKISQHSLFLKIKDWLHSKKKHAKNFYLDIFLFRSGNAMFLHSSSVYVQW